MNTGEFNPRYLAYCRAHGNCSPEEMLKRDAQLWPGGLMTGFILWNSAALAECRKEHPGYFLFGALLDHEGYDKWLESWAGGQNEFV